MLGNVPLSEEQCDPWASCSKIGVWFEPSRCTVKTIIVCCLDFGQTASRTQTNKAAHSLLFRGDQLFSNASSGVECGH